MKPRKDKWKIEYISAATVIAALKKKSPMPQGQSHAWLQEVRNATGYDKRQRYADALVVSLWPSRGIWFAGIEVKVSRSDWLRELKDPDKSSDIQKYCNYWWIATAPGIVKSDELPKTWGLFETDGKKVTVVRQAPALKPAPLEPSFVASLLRNAGEGQHQLLQEARTEGARKEREEFEEESKKIAEKDSQIYELTRSKEDLQRQVEYTKKREDDLRFRLKSFENQVGLPEGIIAGGHYAGIDSVVEHYKLATLLKKMSHQRWHEELSAALAAVEALRAIEQEAKAAG